MKVILILVISTVLLGYGTSSLSEDSLGYQGQKNKGLTVPELLTKLKSNPDARISNDRGWEIVSVKSERALYSFTPESHPAYPSYVKREVVESEGRVQIKTSVKCRAEKNVCDQLVKDFIALNNQIKEKVNTK